MGAHQFASSKTAVLLKDTCQVPALEFPKASNNGSGVVTPEVACNQEWVVINVKDLLQCSDDNLFRDSACSGWHPSTLFLEVIKTQIVVCNEVAAVERGTE